MLGPQGAASKAFTYDSLPCSDLEVVFEDEEEDDQADEDDAMQLIMVGGEQRWEKEKNVAIFVSVKSGHLEARTGRCDP